MTAKAMEGVQTSVTDAAPAERSAAVPSSSVWGIRAGSFLVPLAHAAGMNLVTVLGLRFLTDSLAITSSASGMIFGLVKIYDGLLDPAVGALSDRARTRWGRRLPFLFAGALLMPLGIVLLFGAPDFGSVLLAELAVTLALILHATGYTLLTIPGFAMVVEGSADHHERTRLMAWRVFGNSGGTLIGSTLPAWVLAGLGTGRTGYLAMALVIGMIVLVAGLLAVVLLRNAPRTVPAERPGEAYSMERQARLAWRNVPFRVLTIAHVFLLFGTAIGSAGMAYFSRYVIRSGDGWLGTFFMFATIGTVGSMPLWVRLTRVIGKKAGYMGSLAGYGLLNLAWLTAAQGEGVALTGARGIALGICAGGMILCAYAMLSDAVRYDFVRNGERREGAFAGFTTLFDKVSAAIALAVMGSFLSAMGYVPSGSGSAAPQGPGAILAVKMCVSVIPAIAMAAAFLTVAFYRLDPASLAEDAGDKGA